MKQEERSGFPPVWNEQSRVLILGTMPSPQSIANGFYYSHPQNRFWPVLAKLFKEPIPMGKQERRQFALQHHIALWDVLHQCSIQGASDASIRQPVPNDIGILLQKTSIQMVFTTGKKAYQLYNQYFSDVLSVNCISLPSTSPANARMRLENLQQAYRVLLDYL